MGCVLAARVSGWLSGVLFNVLMPLSVLLPLHRQASWRPLRSPLMEGVVSWSFIQGGRTQHFAANGGRAYRHTMDFEGTRPSAAAAAPCKLPCFAANLPVVVH